MKVFTPKDPTAPTIVAVLLIGIVMVVMFWGEIAAGGVSAVVVVGTWVMLAAMAWRASRTMADRKIVVNGNTLELVKGSVSKTVNLSEVESLQQARVKSGRTSYVAFLAFLESGERVELFADGQFADQLDLARGIEIVLGIRAGAEFKRHGQQRVAGQDRHRFAVDLVVRRFPAAKIVVVHRREIVVNEGIGVDQFQ